jgi:hypothetical protein
MYSIGWGKELPSTRVVWTVRHNRVDRQDSSKILQRFFIVIESHKADQFDELKDPHPDRLFQIPSLTCGQNTTALLCIMFTLFEISSKQSQDATQCESSRILEYWERGFVIRVKVHYRFPFSSLSRIAPPTIWRHGRRGKTVKPKQDSNPEREMNELTRMGTRHSPQHESRHGKWVTTRTERLRSRYGTEVETGKKHPTSVQTGSKTLHERRNWKEESALTPKSETKESTNAGLTTGDTK